MPSAPHSDPRRRPNDRGCQARPPGRHDRPRPRSRVPVRTIAATIAMVLLTAAVLLLGWEVRRVLTWIVVAALLAIILGPLVDITERRLHLRRALATLLVFLVAIVALAGILTMFIRPLASEGPQFIDRVPSYVEQARTGRGPVGDLVQRYNLDEYLQRNQARLRESANRLTTPALGVLRSIFSTVVALVTIFVLTFLMVLQGPNLLSAWVSRPTRAPSGTGPAGGRRLRQGGHRLHDRQPADQRHRRDGHLRGAVDHGRALPGGRRPVRRLRRPDPAGRGHPGRRRGRAVAACTRCPPPSSCWSSSSSTSSWRTTSCSR